MDTFPGFSNRPASLNKYAYCEGDPVNKVDPSGNTSAAEQVKNITLLGVLLTLAYAAIPTRDFAVTTQRNYYD
jgi:hypothetical protein